MAVDLGVARELVPYKKILENLSNLSRLNHFREKPLAVQKDGISFHKRQLAIGYTRDLAKSVSNILSSEMNSSCKKIHALLKSFLSGEEANVLVASEKQAKKYEFAEGIARVMDYINPIKKVVNSLLHLIEVRTQELAKNCLLLSHMEQEQEIVAQIDYLKNLGTRCRSLVSQVTSTAFESTTKLEKFLVLSGQITMKDLSDDGKIMIQDYYNKFTMASVNFFYGMEEDVKKLNEVDEKLKCTTFEALRLFHQYFLLKMEQKVVNRDQFLKKTPVSKQKYANQLLDIAQTRLDILLGIAIQLSADETRKEKTDLKSRIQAVAGSFEYDVKLEAKFNKNKLADLLHLLGNKTKEDQSLENFIGILNQQSKQNFDRLGGANYKDAAYLEKHLLYSGLRGTVDSIKTRLHPIVDLLTRTVLPILQLCREGIPTKNDVESNDAFTAVIDELDDEEAERKLQVDQKSRFETKQKESESSSSSTVETTQQVSLGVITPLPVFAPFSEPISEKDFISCLVQIVNQKLDQSKEISSVEKQHLLYLTLCRNITEKMETCKDNEIHAQLVRAYGHVKFLANEQGLRALLLKKKMDVERSHSLSYLSSQAKIDLGIFAKDKGSLVFRYPANMDPKNQEGLSTQIEFAKTQLLILSADQTLTSQQKKMVELLNQQILQFKPKNPVPSQVKTEKLAQKQVDLLATVGKNLQQALKELDQYLKSIPLIKENGQKIKALKNAKEHLQALYVRSKQLAEFSGQRHLFEHEYFTLFCTQYLAENVGIYRSIVKDAELYTHILSHYKMYGLEEELTKNQIATLYKIDCRKTSEYLFDQQKHCSPYTQRSIELFERANVETGFTPTGYKEKSLQACQQEVMEDFVEMANLACALIAKVIKCENKKQVLDKKDEKKDQKTEEKKK